MKHTLIDKDTGIILTVDDSTKKGKKEYIEKSESGEYDELFYYDLKDCAKVE